MAILKGAWGLLGSESEGARIDVASRISNLDLDAMHEEVDETMIADEARIAEMGLRADTARFAGMLDSPLETRAWANVGAEVILLVNEGGAPTRAQTNPTGMHMAIGPLAKFGPLVGGAVGDRRDYEIMLAGARVGAGRDGVVAFEEEDVGSTTRVTTWRGTDARDEILIPVWWSVASGVPTALRIEIRRHDAAGSFTASADIVVPPTQVISGAKNFKLFRSPGGSADDRLSARTTITPSAARMNLGVAFGTVPQN